MAESTNEMIHWQRTGSLAKLLLGEWGAILLLGAAYADIRLQLGAHECPPVPKSIGVSTVVAFLVGLYLLQWLFKNIFFAKIIVDQSRGALWYSFLSTHPSYVFIDMWILGLGWLIRTFVPDGVGCDLSRQWLLGKFVFGVALALPIFRLLCWYTFGWRRISREDKWGILQDAWKPIIRFYAILLVPAILAAWIIVPDLLDRHRVPVADATTLAGGLSAHPDLDGTIMKAVGTIRSEHVQRCDCRGVIGNDCFRGDMLIDLGPGGEVIVQAVDAGELAQLVTDTEGKPGKPYSIIGRLHKLPDAKAKLCVPSAYGPPPAAGRALLRPELPNRGNPNQKPQQSL
jgi:hypothetical protein